MTKEEAIKFFDRLKAEEEKTIESLKNGFGSISSAHQRFVEYFSMASSALREQEDHIREVTKKVGWISVNDRLPEKSTPVLAYKDGRIWYCERNWQSGCWESLSFTATKEYGMYWSKGPTHRMPMPEPPKEEV